MSTTVAPRDAEIETPRRSERLRDRLRRVGFATVGLLAAAGGLGAYLRLWRPATADFPLNDGGLFYLMARELAANGFALPAFTSYNGAIPFAYPPLGLYLMAVVSQATGASLLDVQRLLPAVLSVLTIPLFFSLSRRLLGSAGLAAAATLAFALLPRTWLWFIMGGGITRALGFAFALLMFDQLLAAYAGRGRKAVVLATLSGAGLIVSHLENAWFGAYSAVLLFLAYGRSLRGLAVTVAVGVGAVALSAPWWGTVLRQHGAAPFLHAAQSRGQDEFTLDPIRYFTFSHEPFLPVLGVLGMLGAAAAIISRRLVVPVWLVLIFIVNPRNPATPAAVPLAMLVAIAACEVVAPGVNALLQRYRAPGTLARLTGGDRLRPALIVFLPILGYVFFSSRSVAGNSTLLHPLFPSDRRAMAWIASETPDSARILVLTGRWFGEDAAAEWLPALTGRISVATVQGSEWLPGARFYGGWKATDSLRACRTAACLRRLIRKNNYMADYVYMRVDGPRHLLEELRRAADFQARYDQDSVVIFQRPR
jgi:hypothetical protein